MGFQARGVPQECQVLVDQESLGRRAVRGDKEILDFLDYLVSM